MAHGARDYDHLFKLLIIGDSGTFFNYFLTCNQIVYSYYFYIQVWVKAVSY